MDSHRNLGLVVPLFALAAAAGLAGATRVESPGLGDTAAVERSYLERIIDHHYSALRMTELAAGTELGSQEAGISTRDNTQPSPGFPATERRATLPEVVSLARRNNRLQREEILTAARLLREWYGVEHAPALTVDGLRMIEHLSSVPSGPAFDAEFLRTFSVHHAGALGPTVDCLIGSDLDHEELERYCRGVLHAQLSDIDEMRSLLCRHFGDCDFVVHHTP